MLTKWAGEKYIHLNIQILYIMEFQLIEKYNLSNYLEFRQSFNIHFRFKLRQGDNLCPILESNCHDSVHGIDVEEGQDCKCSLLEQF